MQLMTQYVAPLTHWLHCHPYMTLFFTFLIAFAESLAIIGSIIPGSVTMTAIGILAGSGIIRIDLTLICATLGAVAGDGMSYFIGYILKDRLLYCWPFSRYPGLLSYGKGYFEKHGGKSVLIGRFVGPLRSIIPVIAGMMHMPAGRFLIANILSGIGWAILYVTPGILIGAASHELSPERATRLVALTFMVLLGVWVLSLGIKSLLLRTHRRLYQALHQGWVYGLQQPSLRPFFRCLTPPGETHHANTAWRYLFLVLCLLGVITLLHYQENHLLMFSANEPLYAFFQSIRIPLLDILFAIFQQTLSPLPVITLFLFTFFQRLISHETRGVLLWLGFSSLMAYFVLEFPAGFMPPLSEPIFPTPTMPLSPYWLVLATFCYLGTWFHQPAIFFSWHRRVFRALLLLCVVLGIFSGVYLGDYWITTALLALLGGVTLSLFYGIVTLRANAPGSRRQDSKSSAYGLGLLLLSNAAACMLQLESSLAQHHPTIKQHIVGDPIWWHQDKPLLPPTSYNRLGKPTILFNIQYNGSLKTLAKALHDAGWQTQKPSLLHTVLRHLDHHKPLNFRAFKENLFMHQKPYVTFVYHALQQHRVFRLELWRSYYYLNGFESPIWVGYVQLVNEDTPNVLLPPSLALIKFRPFLKDFTRKTIELPLRDKPLMLLIRAEAKAP